MRRFRYLELVLYKGLADLNSDASRAYIGFLWWILEPLLYMGAFYVAFGLGIRGGGVDMLLFLLCGLVPWKWFSSTVQNGSDTIPINNGLIQQIYLPKYILPWVSLVTSGIKFLIILSLLLVFTVCIGHWPTLAWLALPVLVLAELLFTIAVTSLAAAVVPLLPDLGLIIDNGLIVMMFLSGIFFNMKNLPPTVRTLLEINPIVPVINGYRAVLMDGTWPAWGSLAWVVGISAIMYAVAFRILQRFDRIYPKVMVS